MRGMGWRQVASSGVKSVMRISCVQYIPRIRPPIRFQAGILHDIRIIHTGVHLPVKWSAILFYLHPPDTLCRLIYYSWFYVTYPTWSSHICSPCRIYFVTEPHPVDSTHLFTRWDDTPGRYICSLTILRKAHACDQAQKAIEGLWSVC